MAEMKNRLMQYAALAAALPAAGAQAGIVAHTGLDVVIHPGEFALIDFGPGFGEVFRFEVRTTLTERASGFYNAIFQFNTDNTGGIDTAGFLAPQGTIPTSSGGSYVTTYNDPQRLEQGAPISVERVFYEPMSGHLGTSHDIAGKFPPASSRASGFGSWYPNIQGYIGFKMFKDGSFHFGWFDVETRNWSDPQRNGVSPELIIHGWGFRDTVRDGINAGDVPAPAAGGLLALALGAAGLRRSRQLTMVA